MSAAAWAFLTAGVTVTGTLVMFFVSRRHKEGIEDAGALTAQITAIGEVAVALVNTSASTAAMVEAQIHPLQERMTAMQAEIDTLNARVGHVIDYVRMLRQQVRDGGMEPYPPPDPLEGFTFD